MQLEVIATGAAEAAAAQQAGATRVELVSGRDKGGLTPSEAEIAAVTRAVRIPVNVMLRPHDAGFVYDGPQQKVILRSAARMRDLGASAVVFGALDRTGHIDAALVREVLSASGLPMTFHRAFDAAPSLTAAYKTLSAIEGVTRVLTSGGAASAWEGRLCLRELCRAGGVPSVLAAGSVGIANLVPLLQATGVREVHVGSAACTGGSVDPSKVARLAQLLAEYGARAPRRV